MLNDFECEELRMDEAVEKYLTETLEAIDNWFYNLS